MTYSVHNSEPVHCSMSNSNCCFLTCRHVSQNLGKVVWYSYLFKNCPQFVVIHTVKGFSIVNEAEGFLEFSCFFYDPMDVGNLISGSFAFAKSSLYLWKFPVHTLWSLHFGGDGGQSAVLTHWLTMNDGTSSASLLEPDACLHLESLWLECLYVGDLIYIPHFLHPFICW